MDFDRYFTVNEQDLHNASYSSGDWEHSAEPTARLQIRLEDSLTDHMSTSPPNRQRAQIDAKPLPAVPEEPEISSSSMHTSKTAAPSKRYPKAVATKIPGADGRQKSPRRGSGSSLECSPDNTLISTYRCGQRHILATPVSPSASAQLPRNNIATTALTIRISIHHTPKKAAIWTNGQPAFTDFRTVR